MGILRCVGRGLLPLATLIASGLIAGELPTIETIRERLEAIGIRSVRSADGHLVVSGPDSFSNAMLLAQAGEIRQRVQAVVGIPLPFTARSVRVMITPASEDSTPVVLEHAASTGLWIHRVVFADYPASQTREGLETMAAAFLALYIHPGAAATNQTVSFAVPVWLRQGVVQVLTDEDRSRTLDQAMRWWREGRLPSPVQIVTDTSTLGAAGDDAERRLRVARGAFVLWAVSMDSGGNALAGLFKRLSEGQGADGVWLRDQLAAGGDPGELWDRWMLSQRQVVRSLGRLTLAHLEGLQAEWLLQAGTGGIPAEVSLPPGADGVSLMQYRDQSWFQTAVRQKRYRLEMLAQGRPERFHELVAIYVRVLDAIESGERPAAVVGMAVAARRQWQALYETVQQAGGTWSEP